MCKSRETLPLIDFSGCVRIFDKKTPKTKKKQLFKTLPVPVLVLSIGIYRNVDTVFSMFCNVVRNLKPVTDFSFRF
jgi:hypothetical protein